MNEVLIDVLMSQIDVLDNGAVDMREISAHQLARRIHEHYPTMTDTTRIIVVAPPAPPWK